MMEEDEDEGDGPEEEKGEEEEEGKLGPYKSWCLPPSVPPRQAFEYLESGKEFPSMMLLDVMMPGPSGFEVVAQIRNQRNLSHSQLPVVMLSARSPQEATASEAFRCGATDYMQKPFCSVVLKHRLNVMEEVRQEIRKAQAPRR